MKISVILTGGTIGSKVQNGYISPADGRGYLLLQNYIREHGSGEEFIISEPYTALSETLNAEKLNMLIDAVKLQMSQGFDGIIITHGTDTLQYSAAALSLVLPKDIPIVLVSSNYPLNDERSNGNDNFYAGVELVKSGEKGVFVAYRNADGRIYYHRGDSILRHAEMSDEVYSIGGPYGKLVDGRVEFFQKSYNREVEKKFGHFVTLPGILTVTARPGDEFNYCLDDINAVLLQPYHSGTLDVESSAFRSFCLEAASKKIPVFIADVLEGGQYATSKQFGELGLIPLTNEPSVLAFMKLWLAVSLKKDIKKFMCQGYGK